MKVLWPMAIGVLLVGIEFRLNALDALADPLGWLLIAAGAWLLRARGAALLAVVAAPLSGSTVWLGYHMALIDSTTGEEIQSCGADAFCYREVRYDDLSTLRSVAVLGAVLAGGAALVWIIRILRTEVGDPTKQLRLRQQLAILELAVAVVWVLPVAVFATRAVLSGDGYDPIWDEGLELLGYARFVVMAWLAVVLFVFADRYPRPVRERVAG
jgi:hypothetical protein